MRLRVAAAAAILAVACAPADEAPEAPATPQELTYTATDFAFEGADTVAPGITTIRMVNNGAQDHHIILAKLGDGHTLADLMAAYQANPNAEPEWLTFEGGAGAAAAGGTSSATQELTPGTYVLICFLPDASDNMTPHIAKGMIRELVVTGEANTAPAPTAMGDIVMTDFAFEVPTITAGTHTFRVVNNGPQLHEVALVRLNDGATMDQFLASLAPGSTTPPPGVPVGGNGAISTGRANWFTATFEPGTYLLVCFVPDPADGMPHIVKGMVKEVVIPAATS